MPEYLAPGVYVEEIDTGSKPIEGVSTSTAGMVGVTERGPVNVPILITSYGEFRRWFGDEIPADAFPEHCFLPHAVNGFFTNGGKRVYITRVIDGSLARRSAFSIFFDGTAGAGSTVLLRGSAEFTASAANPPPLVALSGNNLAVNDRVRIGDGSDSEYRQIASIISPDTVVVPAHLPFSRTHAANAPIRQFTLGAAVRTFNLVAAVSPGSRELNIEGATADINALANDQLLRIDGALGEYRFIRGVTNVVDATAGRRTARITLDASLALSHIGVMPAVVNTIEQFNIPAAPPNPVRVTPASASGAAVVFVDNRGGAFNTRTDLVLVDEGVPDRQEVRRIGELHQVTLGSGVALGCGAGSIVSEVGINASTAITVQAAPAPTTTVLGVNDVSRITLQQTVLIGPTAVPRTVTTLTSGVNPTITVSPALAAPPAAGEVVVPVRRLTAAANVNATFLALDNRLGLTVGDVLRIASAAAEEFVVIDVLPDPAPPGVKPDSGSVVLNAPLTRPYDTATTQVVQMNMPAPAGLQSTAVVLDVRPGGDTLLLADGAGYTAAGNRAISIRTPEGETSFHRVTALAATAVPVMIELVDALIRPHPVGAPVVERLPLLDVEALDVGEWGNRLRVSVEDEVAGMSSTALRAVVIPPNQIRLLSLVGIEPGSVLEMRSPDGSQPIGSLLKVQAVDRTSGVVTLQAPGLDLVQQAAIAALLPGRMMQLKSREFRFRVELLRRPDQLFPGRDTTVIQQEDFRYLSMDPRHSHYAPHLIGSIGGSIRRSDRRPEGDSWLIRVRDASNVVATQQGIRVSPETLVDILPDGRNRPARHPLSGGNDAISTLTVGDYIGQDDLNPELRTGLQSLRNIEDISIVAAPGNTLPALQDALINHCELMRYRFAVLDGNPPPKDTMADIQNQRKQFDTKYAALYHPWLLIPDPYPQTLGVVPDYPIPPSGHMLGVYARTDIERGVHKAPANEVVRGVIGLQRLLNKEQHDILNPYPVNINVIRDFRNNNRGIRVYGGRVITSDSDWKYVNVRRLLIFIEASIDRGVQWVVFEPNAEPLWARVRRSISNFLTLVWRNGALEGTKPEEAYFVKCDRTTMTQTDIDSGRLICVIGVAPVKPAEFVIIRIGLWTAHADDQS
jgi:phage tail sheath protein FI